MDELLDPLEDSQLILQSVQVYREEWKEVTFAWILNNYDELRKSILYRSHYIRINGKQYRFCLRRTVCTDRRYSNDPLTRLYVNLIPFLEAYLELSFCLKTCAGHESHFSTNSYDDSLKYFLNESYFPIKRDKLEIICKIRNLNKDDEIILPLNEFDNYLDLSARMSKMFVEEESTDVKLLVDDEEFDVHRAVLVCSSPVFANMLQTETKKKKENIIRIEDCDSDVFQVFLHFIYSGRLKPLTEELATHLFKLADKYCLDSLKLQAGIFLGHNLSMTNVIELYKMADLSQDENLKSATLDFMARNLQEIMKSPEWSSLRASSSFMDILLPILSERVL